MVDEWWRISISALNVKQIFAVDDSGETEIIPREIHAFVKSIFLSRHVIARQPR
ncbi:MAG: hypothetical protein Hyperionvirus20_39 [Hyperionvirus sp.]|uniref:Uncharacterized protein n=1 Tax=Hyperionvirus sp. TaxID=2487770 RepID=A0A3G5ADB3_9VIRU|nr:MAG: hypothetical protein Hyperionvirus20_39 [Hyperionvirus sp.]